MINFINPQQDEKTLEIISRFQKEHGDRYNYSLVVFFKSLIKVTIICKIHGAFNQRPDAHLDGCGCAKCGKGSKSATLSTAEMIQKFNDAHGVGTYDYSNTVHTGVQNKVVIICPKHTWFLQTPHAHLKGDGCPCCAGRFPKDHRTRCEVYADIHQNKYDYSSLDLYNAQNVRRQQTFLCNKHGIFKLTLSQHLHQGCPKCDKSNH